MRGRASSPEAAAPETEPADPALLTVVAWGLGARLPPGALNEVGLWPGRWAASPEARWPGRKARAIGAGGDHELQAQDPWAFRTRFSSPPHF